MPRIMKMPKIGVNMTDAVIVGWMVKEGDAIKEGDVILEAETDKSVQDIEATESGVIGKILAKEGEKVLCQHPIAVLLDEGESLEDDYIRCLPKIGSSDQTRDMKNTDNANKDIKIKLKGESPGNDGQNKDGEISTDDRLQEVGNRIRISPLAKRIARELGIDYKELTPLGEGKTITKDDVLYYAQALGEGQTQDKTRVWKESQAQDKTQAQGKSQVQDKGGPSQDSGPDGDTSAELDKYTSTEPDKYIPFTGVRRVIADRMSQSSATKPSAALTLEADAGMLVKWRSGLKQEGKPVSYDALLTSIVARALKEYPYINSRLDGEKIVLIKDINIGVAVDSQRGLVVPVIKNADKMGILKINDVLSTMVGEIKKGRVSVQYLEGGTFTITNLGMFEIEQFTPIINPPECCILAVGAIVKKPVILKETETISIAHRMQLTLVFDHRMVDGAPAARFLRRIKQLIEFPFLGARG